MTSAVYEFAAIRQRADELVAESTRPTVLSAMLATIAEHVDGCQGAPGKIGVDGKDGQKNRSVDWLIAGYLQCR